VLRVLVKPGDTIEKEQAVLEIETDKATIEVPSSVAGQIKEIKIKAGDKVKVGQTILSVDGGEGPIVGSPRAAPVKAPAPPAAPEPAPAPAAPPPQARAEAESQPRSAP